MTEMLRTPLSSILTRITADGAGRTPDSPLTGKPMLTGVGDVQFLAQYSHRKTAPVGSYLKERQHRVVVSDAVRYRRRVVAPCRSATKSQRDGLRDGPVVILTVDDCSCDWHVACDELFGRYRCSFSYAVENAM